MPKKTVSKKPLDGLALSIRAKKSPIKRRKRRSLKQKPAPRSYRLDYVDIDILKDTTENVSEISGKMRITDTLVIKALLRVAQSLEAKKILDKIKEVKIET